MLKSILMCFVMPFLKIKYRISKHVLFEKGSLIYPSCRFEGYNRVCRASYISRSYIGFGSYIGNNCNIVSTQIGKYSCIGPYVRTTSGVHPTNYVSMHPAFYSLRGQAGFTYVKKQLFDESMDKGYHIIIGNDVWIGDSALLMEGIRIGNGAVIAAGAIVTKDVPPYAIVAGVPAKILRYRFEEKIRTEIDRVEWWNKDEEWIKNHVEEFADVNTFLNSDSLRRK